MKKVLLAIALCVVAGLIVSGICMIMFGMYIGMASDCGFGSECGRRVNWYFEHGFMSFMGGIVSVIVVTIGAGVAVGLSELLSSEQDNER